MALTCGSLHNASLNDVLKVKPLVQVVRLLRANMVQTNLTPLHQSVAPGSGHTACRPLTPQRANGYHVDTVLDLAGVLTHPHNHGHKLRFACA